MYSEHIHGVIELSFIPQSSKLNCIQGLVKTVLAVSSQVMQSSGIGNISLNSMDFNFENG